MIYNLVFNLISKFIVRFVFIIITNHHIKNQIVNYMNLFVGEMILFEGVSHLITSGLLGTHKLYTDSLRLSRFCEAKL